MMAEQEEIVSSSEESEVENQTPVKKKKGNDYLNMIEENKQKRLAFLKSLNIDEVKKGFCSSVKTLKPKKVFNERQLEPKVQLPPRKSARLATMNMNLSEKALDVKSMEDTKIRPNKFNFKDCVLENEASLDFPKVFSDLELKEPPKPIQFPDYFKRMKSKESWVSRVVPSYISALAIHPSTNKVLVTAGDTYGNIGFWNVTSNSMCTVRSHTLGVINIMFNTFDADKLLSSSYDGRLLCGDLEKQVFEKYYESEDYCNCFDVVSRSTFIVGHRSGDVAIVDSRTEYTKSEKHNCHEHGIRGLSVHPVDQNLFVSANCKGFIRVWDLRMLTTKPFCETNLCKTVVRSVYFSPITGNYILSTNRDCFCVFDSSDLSKGLTVHKNIPITFPSIEKPFKAVWVPNADEQFFAVGSVKLPRRIEVFNRQGFVQNIIDENISAVLHRLAFHSHLPVLAGGFGRPGRVIIFQNS